ncbi:M20/M25/M40 family metallo-hydrolase [Ruficoccus amylovorans]|uniref:M20/M25/M40 family metallo-hydrolase n=1 Tax=Ruficoccus amylovorans TaxID=1804625 RepID=A0A842HEC2_9BACT|nr:M20/M25/M40 family metallo-hydrolase [Ruficoccus amylovorans]MBC2594388.1 M20/M25/M40 family metallo-hydrolase [Ruficoccus amylovorans]
MAIDPIPFLTKYASFPSVSTDSAYSAGMKGARDYVKHALAGLGFEVEEVATPKHPIMLAERGPDRDDVPHIVIYGHYDVQPADPFELWKSPAFEPEVRDGRLYGRGTADNKGPQAVQLTALSRLLEKHPDLPLRITFLIEGEEEMGSPSFPGFLEKYADRLSKADMILVSDTGSPGTEQIVITTGLRGMVGMEVTLTGPAVDLHSGVNGGPVLNPIQALATLCASLHDGDGRVNVPGFYDAVGEPLQWEREELARLPGTEEQYRDLLGVPGFLSPGGATPFELVRFFPTLEFNGIGGGYQGEGSKTVIPSKAFVKITCRLVPDQEEDDIVAKVKAMLLERCPPEVSIEVKVDKGGSPYYVAPPGRPNTASDLSPVFARACAAAELAIEGAFGKKPLYLREGGSIPIIRDMKEKTGLDSLMIGLFTPRDNLHAPNESFELDMMEKGINAYEDILYRMAYPAD